MCGRYTLTADFYKVKLFLGADLANDPFWAPRYNIAPTQMAPVLFKGAKGERQLSLMKWGLVPSWSKDEKIGYKMINARSETVHEKPSFRTAFLRRRCVVPADSFYEWQRQGETKTPMRIMLKDQDLFGIAGLWETWTDPKGEVMDSFTLLTTEANELMRPIHDRMPVILPNESFEPWLDPAQKSPAALRALLAPLDSSRMEAHAVSTLVNSPRNDVPECIQPT